MHENDFKGSEEIFGSSTDVYLCLMILFRCLYSPLLKKDFCKLECLKVILFGEKAIGPFNFHVDICCVTFLYYFISLSE